MIAPAYRLQLSERVLSRKRRSNKVQSEINPPQRLLPAEDREAFKHARADGDARSRHAQDVVQVTGLDILRLAESMQFIFQRLCVKGIYGPQRAGGRPERVRGAGLAQALLHGR